MLFRINFREDMSKQKYNILIIMSDEQRFDTLSCYGNPIVKTPYIDSLAAEGVRFTDCNTSYPLCCPARVSLFTGLRPDNHGVLANWRPMKPEHAHGNFIRQFRRMGYTATYTGKWHITGSTPEKFGFNFYNAIPAIIDGRDRGRAIPEYREYLKEKGYSTDNIDLENQIPEERKQLGIPGKAPCGRSRYKKEDYLEPWLTRQWKTAMDNITSQFFSVCPFVAPHFPMILPVPYDTYYLPEDVILPDNFFRGMETKPESIYREHFYQQCRDLPICEWKRLIAHYWGFCKMIDDQVGEILDYLRNRDLYDNTIICYLTDHGDMMGSHGLLEKGWPMQYEEINKIPFIMKIPNQQKPLVNDAMISIMDILPIIAETTGTPLDIKGTDAVPIGKRSYIISEAFDLDSKKSAKVGGIPKYLENFEEGEDSSVISIKNKQHKYIYHSDDIDELYDLTADSQENNNIICNANNENIVKLMKTELLNEIKNNKILYNLLARNIFTVNTGKNKKAV